MVADGCRTQRALLQQANTAISTATANVNAYVHHLSPPLQQQYILPTTALMGSTVSAPIRLHPNNVPMVTPIAPPGMQEQWLHGSSSKNFRKSSAAKRG